MHDRFCRSIRSNFLFLPCLLHGFKISNLLY
ncbi:porin family protein, partial [Salmonella enterica subsp. enterica serovar Virchow]|nr:porin family protein [Salmonella enterica subsp. enterica serovar Virchow]